MSRYANDEKNSIGVISEYSFFNVQNTPSRHAEKALAVFFLKIYRTRGTVAFLIKILLMSGFKTFFLYKNREGKIF